MVSSVLLSESVKLDAGIAGQAVRCMCDKDRPQTHGARWSSRRGGNCAWRLASALAGTGEDCSEEFGVVNGKTFETFEDKPAGGAAMLPVTVAEDGKAVEGCADTCSGKLNVKRTGEFISSASIASRGATDTNTYPGASADPTVNGCAGFPSTAISAAPLPTLLAITPDKINLSAGLDPEPTCGNDVDPRRRANPTVLVRSGDFRTGATSVVMNLRADEVVCAQNQLEITTNAQTRLVTLRQPNILYDLSIKKLPFQGYVFARKSFQNKSFKYPATYRMSDKHLRGFTLIELMVVLVIIGVLAALIVPNVLDRADDARVMAARTDVNNLNQALKLYKLDNQRLPTTEQGLQALIVKPTATPVPASWKAYLDKLPNDPWGRPYQYLNPGVKGEVDVMSLGADGQPGGEGRNADVGSWQ